MMIRVMHVTLLAAVKSGVSSVAWGVPDAGDDFVGSDASRGLGFVYNQDNDDPAYGTLQQDRVTTMWSDHLLGRPENAMTGVSFARGGYHRIGKRVTAGAGGYTIHRADHWLFAGTGLGYGDVLGAYSNDAGATVLTSGSTD